MKKSVKGIALATAMLMCTSFGVSVSAADEVVINVTNFPDEAFRSYVSERFDTDGSGGLSEGEIGEAKIIIVSGTEETPGSVQSLKGIEYFTALKYLKCEWNEITSLDVSKNTALELLWCGGNQLTSLDVTNNIALKELECSGNQLTSLDVSKNTALVSLWCERNQLTSLDVSKNTALNGLFCWGNQLTALDVNNNTDLTWLDCSKNRIKSLDLSNNAELETLFCYENQLAGLDLSNNPKVEVSYYTNIYGNVYVEPMTENAYKSNTYSLANLPDNFDPSKASDWKGAKYDSTTNSLTDFYDDSLYSWIIYTYDCGNGINAEFYIALYVDEDNASDDDNPAPDNSVSSFVNRLYTILLGRNAEPAGLADWTNRLKSGTATSAEIVSGIAGSQEFANFGLSNDEIVERMYLAMLDRPSDVAGKASWVNGLNSGMTVNGIVNGFSGSQEFGQICAEYGIQAGSVSSLEARDKSAGLTSFIARMYTKALGRSYDVAGLNDWTGRYLTGQEDIGKIAYGFIFSPEFVNKGLSDSDYVDTLYRTFFNREPDEGGKADWMSKLAGGMSREDVLSGFVGSQECANLVASFGIG